MYIAHCQWFWRNEASHEWEQTPDDAIPEKCRVTIGKKFITVWLPAGAKIRCQFKKYNTDPLAQTFYHFFGPYTNGFKNNKIEITVLEVINP